MTQETHEPDVVYALPADLVIQAPELKDVIRGVASTTLGSTMSMTAALPDLVDDSTLVSPPEWIRLNSCAMLCFRVVHLNPAAQKLIKPAACTLRQDHVAIVPYTVTDRCAATGSLTITSSFSLGGTFGARVFSLETFLKAGTVAMATSFTRLRLCTQPSYMIVPPEDEKVGDKVPRFRVQQVVTDLVNSSAYPGPWGIYYLPDTEGTSPKLLCLALMLQEGWVERLGTSRYRMTQKGFDNLVTTQKTVNCTRVLEPRSEIALCDCTTHELLCKLRDQGWSCKMWARQWSRKIVVIPGNVQDDQKLVFFNSKTLDVGKSYLEVLLRFDELHSRGVPEVRHRQPVWYYDKLLGRRISNNNTKRALIDDTMDLDALQASMRKVENSTKRLRLASAPAQVEAPSDPVAPPLMIEDAQEGDPDDESLDGQADGQADGHGEVLARDAVQSELSHTWCGFSFSFVKRVVGSGPRRGQNFCQWQVVCKQHRNPHDKEKTFCTRTLQCDADTSRDVLHKLRAWCLAGRYVPKTQRNRHRTADTKEWESMTEDELHQSGVAAKAHYDEFGEWVLVQETVDVEEMVEHQFEVPGTSSGSRGSAS